MILPALRRFRKSRVFRGVFPAATFSHKPHSGRKPPPAVVSGHVAVWYLAVFPYGYEWRGTCMHQADDEAAFYMNRFRSITALLAAASALAFAQDPQPADGAAPERRARPKRRLPGFPRKLQVALAPPMLMDRFSRGTIVRRRTGRFRNSPRLPQPTVCRSSSPCRREHLLQCA